MNKKFLSMTAVASMLLFAACSNENDPIIDNAGEEASVVSEITLALNSGGDGLTTRAARPVYSSAAANNVDEVQLKLYKKDNNAWKEVTDANIFEMAGGKLSWSGPTGEGTPGTTDRKAEKTIRLKNLEASASYKILAYGYNGTPAYNFSDAASVWTATLKQGSDVEEIFAGEAEFSTGDDKKISDAAGVEVEMNRQVAGLLGYFKNIPIQKADANGDLKTVKFIKVYASASVGGFTFPSTEVFNGKTQKDGKTELLSYDLSKLISDYTTQTANPKEGATFTIPAKTETPATVANSLLDGRFIMPSEETVNANTITIELQDASNKVLRTWNVKATTANAADGSTADPYKYDIKRNYFYSIGKKLKSDTTDPTDPKDPDKPIDLNNDNEISLILNDAWDVIYDMELGD